MVDSPLIRPYFLGGMALWGVPLDCHDLREKSAIAHVHIPFRPSLALLGEEAEETPCSVIASRPPEDPSKRNGRYSTNRLRGPNLCVALGARVFLHV